MLECLALVEEGEVVVRLVGKDLELAEVEFLQQFVAPGQADQVVEITGVVERLDDFPHSIAVADLGDLAGEDFCVGRIEMDQRVLDGIDFLRDLLLGFEKIRVMLHLVPKLGLELVEVGFVGFLELGLDVREVHDVAVAEGFVGSVYAGERLEEVVRLDDATEVKLLQPPRIEAGEKHVIDEEDVDFPVLEILHPLLPLLLGALVVEDEGMSADGAIQIPGDTVGHHILRSHRV